MDYASGFLQTWILLWYVPMNPMERIRNCWFIRKGKFQVVEANNFIPANAFVYSKLLPRSTQRSRNAWFYKVRSSQSVNQKRIISKVSIFIGAFLLCRIEDGDIMEVTEIWSYLTVRKIWSLRRDEYIKKVVLCSKRDFHMNYRIKFIKY